jgi:hypothetical protein
MKRDQLPMAHWMEEFLNSFCEVAEAAGDIVACCVFLVVIEIQRKDKN